MADPVNCANGNLVESLTDLALPGRGRALNWTRTYNALDAASATAPGPLGFGWTHAYMASITTDGAGAKTVHQGNGATVTFTPSGSAFTAAPWVTATLTGNPDGTFTFTLADQRADVFDATGTLIRQTDRNGYVTTLTYDGANHLTGVTDPAGRTLSVTTDGSGRITRVVDPLGRSIQYGYDASNNLTTVTDVAGGVTSYAYDSRHRLAAITDPNGGVVTNVYDTSNRVVSQIDPAGRTVTFAYGAGTTTVTDAKGHVTVHTHTNNVLTALTSGAGTPDAGTWTYTYDAGLNRTSTTDPNGHTSTATYDSQGNQLSDTDPLGRTTTRTFDSRNNLTSHTDPLGVTTTLTYDTNGNLTSMSRPLTGTSQTQTTTFVYADPAHPGDITAVVDANGQTWQRVYDAAGNLVTRIDPAGDTWTAAYNAIGWPTSTIQPRGNVSGGVPSSFTTSLAYNAFGELTALTDPLGHTTTSTYDANRNLLTQTDPKGHTTTFNYNADNERTQATRADGSVSDTAYDGAGLVTVQTDALGHQTLYAYDARNRLVSATDPVGRVTQYAYDAAGNRLSVTAADGQTTTYGYDAANQLTSISYSDGLTPNVTFAYDSDGRRTSMHDGTGTSTFVYDSLHRLVSATDGAGQTVGYGYDLRGNLTRLTYPSGAVVTRGFDAVGRLTSVKDWLRHTTAFRYDPDGNLTGVTYPNGVTGTFTHDDADRLTRIAYASGGRRPRHLLGFDYTRDAMDFLASVVSDGVSPASETYAYTDANRLSAAGATSYAYDAAGNLIQGGLDTLTYDDADQLTHLASASFTYDARGNRLQRTSATGVTSYTYDQADRLIRFGSTAQYAYNGDGLRASKTVLGGAAKKFAWDRAQGLPLLLQDGTTQFVYGPGGQPIEQVDPHGKVFYFHWDQLGSTRALTNPKGRVVATYSYEAYGQVTGNATTPLQYAGQFTDFESGFQYLRARYYDPDTAQFFTRDPLVSLTREPYRYVMNNPVNGTDPSGLLVIGTEQGRFMLRLFENVGGEPYRFQWRSGGNLYHIADSVKYGLYGLHYASETIHYYLNRSVASVNRMWVVNSYPAWACAAGMLTNAGLVAGSAYGGYLAGSWLADQPVPNLVGAENWNYTFGNAFVPLLTGDLFK